MDEGEYLRIITMLTELKTEMIEQKTSMRTICDFKDVAIKTFQNFDDYKESRKLLPDQIKELQEKTARCHLECQHRKEGEDSYHKKTDYLMIWSYKISGIQIVISAIAALIVILVQLKIIKPW